MVKVRIQLLSESGGNLNPFSVAKGIYTEGGVKSFYRGLDAGLARQAVYTTTRLGIYFSLQDYLK
jgi:solute carrier family 25 oxoglutarate transporter 11